MPGSQVLYQVEDRVAGITINRPERRNALTSDAISLLRGHLARARDDTDVRVVVLRGAGEAAFCSGVDLAELSSGADFGVVAGLFEDLWGLGKPTIASVRGYALAGGFGLALSCDLVVCSDDSTFGTPEIDIGLWPYLITVPLVRAMPPKKALELMLTGRRVSAQEAERIGFVARVVPAADLSSSVAELASSLAAKSPTAMKRGRDSFYAVWDLAAADALAHLQPLLTETAGSDEAHRGAARFVRSDVASVATGAAVGPAAATADQGHDERGAQHLEDEDPEDVLAGRGPDQGGHDAADDRPGQTDADRSQDPHGVRARDQQSTQSSDDQSTYHQPDY